MDPSATLEQCRKLLAAKNLTLSDSIRILDAFQNLDEWITTKGELPRQWSQASTSKRKATLILLQGKPCQK